MVETDNVIDFPKIGRAINADDQGIYFARNSKTGHLHSIYRLDFAQEWMMHQLEAVGDDHHAWRLMAAHANDSMVSMRQEDIAFYFNRPEFEEPKGAWQVILNSVFGFGKFTPEAPDVPVSYAMIPFHDLAMGMPILITKADESALALAKQQLSLETA